MRFAEAASMLALAFVLSGCDAVNGMLQGGEHADAGHGENTHDVHVGPSDAHAAPAHAPAHAPAPQGAAHADPSHWSYLDQTAWAGASATCGAGHEQSPINLASASPMSELADLNPRYLALEGALVNNGHTLQFTQISTGSALIIGQQTYNFVQFHFHSSAEHTLDRRAFPIELHFVHRNSQGQLAVVGVFIEEGAANEALDALIAAKPSEEGEGAATHLTINPNLLLPQDRTYFAYAGSLTTPPCSEGVRWNVLRTPITASREQIATLREALGASARHVQPAYERTVLLGS